MSDSLDISIDDIVAQYREELAKQIGEKLLLQAAVKIMGDQNNELRQQVQQLTDDLMESVEAARPVPIAPDHPWEAHQNGPVPGQYLPPLREKKSSTD